MTQETDLYAPVKALLEARGYEVKSEIKDCDVVGLKEDAPVVIVELKLVFSLELLLQGIERQTMTDDVYLAVLAPTTPQKRKNWRKRQKGYIKVCRKLGLGLMSVPGTVCDGNHVDILLDPKPYKPRINTRKQTRLIAEFQDRKGDPNIGGSNRRKIVTVYRQEALRCAVVLSRMEEMKVAEIRAMAGVAKAATILQKNHYGWFERKARGVYSLTSTGHEDVKNNSQA